MRERERERGSDDCLFVVYVKIWNVSKTNKNVKNLPNTSKFVNFKTKKSPDLGYFEKHSYKKLLSLTIQTSNIFYFLGWFLSLTFLYLPSFYIYESDIKMQEKMYERYSYLFYSKVAYM